MKRYKIYFFAAIALVLVFVFATIRESVHDNTIHEEYYIPCNYTGWVNIIYNQPGKSKFYKLENSRIFLLSGDLANCYVNTNQEKGPLTINYYRYCKDEITKLKSPVFDREIKTHVPVAYSTSIKIDGKWHNVESFYISRKPLSRALPDSALPINSLKNFIPAEVIE